MTVLLLIFMIVFFLGLDALTQKFKKLATHKVKQEIYYHDPIFLPTPTMADGGELIKIAEVIPKNPITRHLTGHDIDHGQYDDIDFDAPAKEIEEIENKRILEIVTKELDKK